MIWFLNDSNIDALTTALKTLLKFYICICVVLIEVEGVQITLKGVAVAVDWMEEIADIIDCSLQY